MLEMSETFMIGFDLSYEDQAALSVTKTDGNHLTYVNTLYGQDAIEAYLKLVSKPEKNEGGNK